MQFALVLVYASISYRWTSGWLAQLLVKQRLGCMLAVVRLHGIHKP